MAQIGYVIYSLMSLSVASDYSSPVYAKDDMQSLKADVLHNLVIGPLQKCRVYGENRLES